MTEDARGIFAADMAANLLAAFLLVLALLPYAERSEPAPAPPTAMTVTSGRAFVDALHRHAAQWPDQDVSIEIRHARDVAAACGRPSGGAAALLVLDAELLPVIARAGCPALAHARLLLVPPSLKGSDGDWSPAVRRLFAAHDGAEDFRRRLLALLQGGGPGIAADAERGALAHVMSFGQALRRWGDFITAAVMLIFLVRVLNARERGSA